VPVDQQVMILYAVTNGLVDDVPTNRVRAFETGFLEYMQTQRPQVGEAIRSTGKMEKDMIEVLVAGVNDYKQTFMAELKSAADAKAAADTATAQAADKPGKGATPKKPVTAPAEKSNTDASKPANPAA
jgi:hypothetical protein